ncbi:MAG TPA: hypothetical protein VGS58_14045 [Candidatus Sulfopaludibacter sp.]|nr:hypothetical protein [Candidatus Sulfopaludibacter sp.]
MDERNDYLDIGSCMGRQQAFAAMANQCSAARALCLKQARESRAFERLAITWDQFCIDYAGISRATADRMIHQYESFGDAYFRLSDIARISPETFQLVAGSIQDGALEVEGESVPLTPEHASKIRAAIKTIRARRRKAFAPAPSLTPEQNEANAGLWSRFQDLLADLRRAAQDAPNSQTRWELGYLAQDAAKGLLQFANDVRANPAA